MPVELLSASPFADYLLPELILFGLLGVLPLLVIVALWFRPAWPLRGSQTLLGAHWAWAAALTVGLALVIWILVQMTILSFFLQPILLALGLVVVGLCLLPSVRRHYALPAIPGGSDGR